MTIFLTSSSTMCGGSGKVNGQNGITAAVYLLSALRIALASSPECMAERQCAAFLGAYTGTFPLRFWAC